MKSSSCAVDRWQPLDSKTNILLLPSGQNNSVNDAITIESSCYLLSLRSRFTNSFNAAPPADLQDQNQIYHYTHCITPKRVSSLWGPSLRRCNTAPFDEILQWWRFVDNTVFNLTSPRYESRSSCHFSNYPVWFDLQM